MTFPMPLVVEKSRTVTIGGVRGSKQSLAFEIGIQTKADLHAMLIGISKEETAQQIRIDNPPQVVEVDNKTNVPIDQAEKKVVVLFGTKLPAIAMSMVESELQQAILASTRPRSFKLQNVTGAWEWFYIPKGGAPRQVTAANPPATFNRGDMLVLKPFAVPYASAVNRAVANSGRLNAHTATTRRKKDGSFSLPPKSSQNLGFLGATVRAVSRRSVFAQFRIIVEFTKSHAVAGEVYSHGTGIIVIRPRIRVR